MNIDEDSKSYKRQLRTTPRYNMVELHDIPDDEFLHNLSTSGVLKRYDGLNDRVQELIRRYLAAKQTIKMLRAAPSIDDGY
jgi:hypothetical protein